MPPIEPQLFGRTIPNPLFGGALFPMIVFGIVCRRLGDSGGHPLRGRTGIVRRNPAGGLRIRGATVTRRESES